MQGVNVIYTYVDGAHFFLSDGEDALGLCVAHKDLETAFHAVAPTLEKLFKENLGKEVTFFPITSLDEIRRLMEPRRRVYRLPVPVRELVLPWSEGSEGAVAALA